MISDPTNNLVSIYAWSDWGACSATCGKATRSRHLICEPEGSPTSSAVRDLQKTAVRDWVNTDDNISDFLSQMELGQGNCIPQWSEWTERISGEDKVRHIKELVDIDVSGNRGLSGMSYPRFLTNINHESNITTKRKTVTINPNVRSTVNGLPGQNAVELVVKVSVPDRLVLSMSILLPMISDSTKLELVTMKTVVSFLINCIIDDVIFQK